MPPPRVGSSAAPERRRGDTGPWGLIWLLPLAALLFVVIVYLPGWVATSRTAASADEPAAAASVPPASLAAAEATSPPATPAAETEPAAAPVTTSRPSPPASSIPTPAPTPDPKHVAFTAAMSAGLAALDAGRADEAVAALLKATRLRPDSAAAAEALQRAQLARDRATIARHVERGRALVAEERWADGLREFEAALKLDGTVAAAQADAAQARRRARLDERLAFHIDNRGRLSDDAVAREADLLLDEAREVRDAGPRLREQIVRLEHHLGAALTPVPVRLRSDGATEVVIYRVGALGTFTEKSLELRPGTYTVVGRRRGYRDVRHQLVVPPNQSPAALLVRCEEAI